MIRCVLIVEDNAETRNWLSRLVESVFAKAQILEAADVRSACHAIDRHAFDLALVDLGLPDGSGIDVLRKLARDQPDTLSIVTTVMAADSAIVAALSAGARGYLLKGETDERIARHLLQLAEGLPALSPQIARRIMEHFRQTGPCAEPDAQLTQREVEVLSLIARGLRILDVAGILTLAESTVASHVKSIYRKLGISSRAEATLYASRLGLIGRDSVDR